MSNNNNNNNIEELEEKLINAINDALEELAVTEVGNIQVNTPVNSGTLKRSIASEVNKGNNEIELILGADGSFTNNKNGSQVEDSAMKAEFSDKSYIRDTLKADKEQIINTIATHLRGL